MVTVCGGQWSDVRCREPAQRVITPSRDVLPCMCPREFRFLTCRTRSIFRARRGGLKLIDVSVSGPLPYLTTDQSQGRAGGFRFAFEQTPWAPTGPQLRGATYASTNPPTNDRTGAPMGMGNCEDVYATTPRILAILEHLECSQQPHIQGRGAQKRTQRAG